MKKTALIVDDSASIRQMVSFTLAQAGFDVLEAQHGRQALDVLAGRKAQIVITDLNMPVMDGIALIRELRKDPANRSVPVLILTTESQEAKKQEARAAGATGWIVKPFQPTRLLQVLGKLLP